MRRIIGIRLLTATWLSVVMFGTLSERSLAAVDVAFQPVPRTVDRGVLFDLQLIATTDSDVDESISAIDVVFTWNPSALEFVGVVDNSPYDWLLAGFLRDDLNDALNDGDAKYTVLANFNKPAYSSAQGLLVATFQFRASDTMDLTTIALIPSTVDVAATQVFGAVFGNQLITGALNDAAFTILTATDCDGDGDFDLHKGHRLQTYFTGAVGPSMPAIYSSEPKHCCGRFDHDDDGDIDIADFEFFTGLLTGPTR